MPIQSTAGRPSAPIRALRAALLPLLSVGLALVLLALPATGEASSGGAAAVAAESDGPLAGPSIVGGSKATIAEWPWQAALFADLPGDRRRFICGGSLLTPTVVVTAAHCVFVDNPFPLRARYFDVVTGRTRLSTSEGQKLEVKKVHVFTDSRGLPLFQGIFDAFDPSDSIIWDVALLELRAPSTSATIKIAGPDERSLWAGDRDAYISGWGATKRSGRGHPDVLHAAKVQVHSDARCRSFVSPEYDDEQMVCAGGGAPERDTCFGDSGGPLVVPVAGGGYRLVGDTSFGPVGPCGPWSVFGRLAGEPIRSMVQAKVLELTGIDVVGSGGVPVPPTMAPDRLTRSLAAQRVHRYLAKACKADVRCFPFRVYKRGVDRCRARGTGFVCKVRLFIASLRSDRRSTRVRKLRVRESKPGGAIKLKRLGHWKKRRGWKR